MLVLILWILILTVTSSNEKCLMTATETIKRNILVETEYNFHCKNTNFENFFYDIHNATFAVEEESFVINAVHNLEIENSWFPTIYSFLLPFPSCKLKNLSLKNLSTEFIQDGAFQDCCTTSIDLSDNKLEDISFVQTLPLSLEKLILIRNKFKAISDVFHKLTSLKYVDLSDCEITTIDPNAFSALRGELFISIRNNNLTAFDALFQDNIILQLDLSHNNIKTIDNKSKRIYFKSLNVSYNKIDIIDISCQDCPYNFYRWSKNVIDLSFNNLKNTKFINSFNDIKLGRLILSNSNIDSNFDFKISNNVRKEMDLSNNLLNVVSPKMFGSNVSLCYLNLFNSSIIDIDARGFDGLSMDVLNMSFNLITKLKNFAFNNCAIKVLDVSKCLIKTIQENAFIGLKLTEVLNLSYNRIELIQNTVFRNLELVKKIDLSFNFISIIESNTFHNCRQLKFLNLAHSKIKIIRRDAFVGTELSELHLENNSINEINFTLNDRKLNIRNNKLRNINLSFLQITSVIVVILSENDIGRLLNKSQSQVSIVQKIDLSRSNISEIDVDAFQGLLSLEFLNLSHNCLETIFPKTFQPLRRLRRLDLEHNQLITFSESAFFFGNVLRELAVSFRDTNITANSFITYNILKSLNISNSRIALLNENCFKGLIHLETLNLNNVEIVDVIPGAFKGLNYLKNIDFKIIFKNANTIKQGTFEGLIRLKLLDLTDLNISYLEAEAFIGLTTLSTLLLNNSKIETIINGTFLGLASVKYLDLSDNLIVSLEPKSFSGLVSLQELFLKNNNLTRLRLGTFQEFPNLKMLNVYNNNINKLLTGTFSNMKSLQVLNLSYNNVTKLKMEVLIPLTGLIRLDLTGNHLIQISRLELINSLKRLQYIGIKGNKWKCDNLAAMLSIFQNYSIDWVSSESSSFIHENIDGIKCYDICKFFYCVDEAEVLWGSK